MMNECMEIEKERDRDKRENSWKDKGREGALFSFSGPSLLCVCLDS